MRFREFVAEYKDIRDPKFMQWFGKSKVVDGGGDPLMVYHGTVFNDEIRTFHDLTHFGSKGAANRRIDDLLKIPNRGMSHVDPGKEQPHIYPVFLKIENPLKMDDLAEWHWSDVWYELLNNKKFEDALYNEYGTDIDLENNLYPDYDLIDHLEEVSPWEWLASKGYDGIYYMNQHEDAGNISWVPFSGKQVMSAFK